MSVVVPCDEQSLCIHHKLYSLPTWGVHTKHDRQELSGDSTFKINTTMTRKLKSCGANEVNEASEASEAMHE